MGGMVFLAVLAVVVVYLTMTYNGLVAIKNNVSKAWANIDVLLKQRHDELPKLIDTCKQYMQYEQATLEQVIQARSRVASAREAHDIAALGAAEGALRAGLGSLQLALFGTSVALFDLVVYPPGLKHRGARRIVCGGKQPRTPEACYYTADHYASFRRIVQ